VTAGQHLIVGLLVAAMMAMTGLLLWY